MKKHWKGEHCKRCGKPYRLGFNVADSIWEKVSEDYSLLCIDCFDELAKEKNIKYAATIYWSGFGYILTEKEAAEIRQQQLENYEMDRK